MAPDCGLRRYSDEPYYPSREAVSEVMSDFQREGVIETRKTLILGQEALQHPPPTVRYGSRRPLPDPLLPRS